MSPMTRWLGPAMTVVVALLLAVTPAAGQEPEPVPPPQTPPQGDATSDGEVWQMPGWSFTPSATMGMLYDSNVALASPRADLGRTEGDWLASVTPGAFLNYNGSRTRFEAGYRGLLRRHFEVEGLDGYNQRGVAGFRHALTRRWSVFARNSFAESPTTDEVLVNGVPFRRTGSQTNMTTAGATVLLSKFVTLNARYNATWVSFDRPDDFDVLTGGWIHGMSTDVVRQVSRRVSVGGEYSYRWASLNSNQRELTFQDAGGIVRADLGPHTDGHVAAGLGTLHDRNLDVTRSGPYVRLGLTHQLRLAQVGGSFQRQYVPSFGFGGSSSSQEVRAYALLPLASVGLRRASAQGAITWRRTQPFEETSLETDTIWIRSNVGYLVTRRSRLEVFYAYSLQDSIIFTGGEVDRHRFGVQFVISQPMRLQ